MLKVRCIVSAEIEKTVTGLLAEYNINVADDSDIIVAESGLETPDNGLVISFSPRRIDLLRGLLSSLSEHRGRSFIIGSRHHTQQIIQNDDILYFRAEGNYVFAVTTAAEYEVKHRLYELERIYSRGFVRTGKSFIVNIMKVEEIIPWFGSRLLLRIEGTEQRIEVSRSYLKQFKEYLEM